MMRKFFVLIISTVLAVIILLAGPRKDFFKRDASEILEIIGQNEYIISMEQFTSLQEQGETAVIDLRNRDEFMDSPQTGAINLPLEEINIQSIRESIPANGLTILYAEKTSTACNAWVLLTQMGYENLLVLRRD